MSLFSEDVQVRYPGDYTERGPYGERIKGEPRIETKPCWFEPRSSSRDVEGGDHTIDGYWVYFPLDVEWDSQCEVNLRGTWYRADGEAGYMPSGTLIEGYLSAPVTVQRG